MLATFDYTVLKSVRAVCPRCFAETAGFDPAFPDDVCDGHLVARDGAVYLRRWCRRGHGDVWSLYEEDAELWQYLQQWRVPTKAIIPDTQTVHPLPFGYEHGLSPAHLQHSCILLLDVTTQCNLTCPACYTSSSPETARFLPLEDVLKAVRASLEREGGRLDVVMVSGGEPTIHPQIRAILTELTRLPVTRVLLNTNGIRLAADREFLNFVSDMRDRLEIYLQYDGQRADTHLHLRARDMTAMKAELLGLLSERRLFTTLVMVVDDRNADQIGEVLDTAFATPYVGGVMFQPLFASGRAPAVDPMRRVTTTGVLRRIESQTGGRMQARDLIALPCSHPDCCSIGYFLKDEGGQFHALSALIGEDDLKRSLTLFANSIAFPDSLVQMKSALLGVMSESMTLSRPELATLLRRICGECELGGLGRLLELTLKPGASARFVGERVKRVTVKHFMDADMLITERLEQCCVHVAGAGDETVRIPFCAARLFPKARTRIASAAVGRAELGAING